MITVILSLTLMAKGALSQPRVKVLGAHKVCNLDAKNMVGMTPLLCAPSEAICWELIKAGATPTFKMKLSFLSAGTKVPEFFAQTKNIDSFDRGLLFFLQYDYL